MNYVYKGIVVGMLCSAVLCCCKATFCQETSTGYPTDEASYAYEAIEYTSGTVRMVSAAQITLREYNYDTDADADVSYSIDPHVELENVDSINDIAVGDIADIDYIVRDGRRVAKHIFVEKLYYEGEDEMYPLEEAGMEEGLPPGLPPELQPPPEPMPEEGPPPEEGLPEEFPY